MVKRVLINAGLALAVMAVHASDVDARVERLARELRCVVCQGQSLAESNAQLAMDMKAYLRDGLATGRSEDELRSELVARYGEQVLLRPAVHEGTLALWWGPLALLALGGLIYWRQAQRRGDGA